MGKSVKSGYGRRSNAINSKRTRCAAGWGAFAFGAMAISQFAISPKAWAVSGTWELNGNDNWSDTAAWLNGIVADNNTDSADSTADFSQIDLTADATVTLDSDRTLTNLIFGNTDAAPAANWTLGGTNTLTLNSSGSAVPTITVNNLGTGVLTVNTPLAGTQGFTKAGPGIMVINNNSPSLSGPITVTGGVLSLGTIANVTSPAGISAIGTGQAITLSGGGYEMGGNQPSPNTFNNPLVLLAGGTGTIASANTANNYTVGITGPADATLTVSGSRSGQAFTFNQTNTTQLEGFLGTLVVSDGNGLGFRNSSSITKNGSDNTTFDLEGTGNIFTRGPTSTSGTNGIILGALTGDGVLEGPQSADSTAMYTIGTKNINTTFSGSIIEGNSPKRHTQITKAGTGTLVLTGANLSYAGTTSIVGGVLEIDGTKSGTGAVAINSGGTLAGTSSGSIAGTTTLNSGGDLDPGTASTVGTINLANLTLAGGTVNTEFNATANDLVNVSGILTINTTGASFNFLQEGTSTPFTTDGTYTLVQFGTLAGSGSISNLTVANGVSGKNYAFSDDATHIYVNIFSNASAVYWNLATGGTWNAAASWTAGGPPNAPGANASFGGGGTAITSAATVTLDGNQTVGTLSFASANSFTVAQGTGNGILTLDNNGATANLTDSQGSHTISAPLALTSFGANVNVVNASDSLTISGALSGPAGASGGGNLDLVGNGTVSLPNANPLYTGTINVLSGALNLGDANSLSAGGLGAGGTINFASGIGTFNLGTLSGGGVITLSDSASQAITLNVSGSAHGTFSGQLTGPGALIRSGTGILTLSGVNNNYTGGTTISSGTLDVGANGSALGGASGSLTMTGGTLKISNAQVATPLNIPSGDTATLEFGNNNDQYTGSITGDSTTTLVVSNSGSASAVEPQLNADNTGFSGTMMVENGSEIRFAKASAVGTNINLVLSGVNGTVGSAAGISQTGQGTFQLGALSGDSTSNFYGYKGGSTPPSDTWQIGYLNTNTTFAGTIHDGADNTAHPTNISKEGTGTLTLTGTNTNTGIFTVDSGTLVVGDGATSGSLANGSTVSISDTGTFIFNRADNVTYAGQITIPATANGVGLLEQNGAGTLTLSNATSLVPQLEINAGIVALGANLTAMDVYLNNNTSLDIGKSALSILDTSQESMVQTALTAAYDHGAWDKAGIRTSAANGAMSTLGYGIVNGSIGPEVEVMYTILGDLDLTGTVDNNDLTAMTNGDGSSWGEGDLNYDGVKNADDWSLFALGAAVGNVANLPAAPEPSMLLLTPLMAMAVRRRRALAE